MAPYNGLIKKGWNVLKQSSLSQQVCRVRLMRVQAILSVVDYILDSGCSSYVLAVQSLCYPRTRDLLSPCLDGSCALPQWAAGTKMMGLEGQVLLMMVLV